MTGIKLAEILGRLAAVCIVWAATMTAIPLVAVPALQWAICLAGIALAGIMLFGGKKLI